MIENRLELLTKYQHNLMQFNNYNHDYGYITDTNNMKINDC